MNLFKHWCEDEDSIGFAFKCISEAVTQTAQEFDNCLIIISGDVTSSPTRNRK